MKRHFTILLLLIGCLGRIVQAAPDTTRSDIPDYRGLVFSLECWPQHSTLAGPSDPAGTLGTIGIGYLVTNHIALSFRVHTGSESIPDREPRPVTGRLLIGGAGLDATYVVHGFSTVAPYICAGFDAYSVLDGPIGYMANGPRIGVGAKYYFSDHFSFEAGFSASTIRYYSTYGDVPPQVSFTPFRGVYTGLTVSISFYPDYIP